MPMTTDEIVQGEVEVIRPVGHRKLYLIPGKTCGTHIPQTLVALDERQLEDYKEIYTIVVEIGDAHPDLAEGIEWEVYGIRRIDTANLPGYPMRKRSDDAVDTGV